MTARTLVHFDCFSGISGDMVLGAVIDTGIPADSIRAALESLNLGIQLDVATVKRCGFRATKATVIAKDEEDYRFLPDIEAIIARSALTAPQQQMARAIFARLAHPESTAHGMALEKVHFHEVGALDSIADILGAAVGLSLLDAGRFTSGPVPTGQGTITCAHGLMPIPTPATAELLRGVPLSNMQAKGELTTPTGAAILTTVVGEFLPGLPPMTIRTIGLGAGTKDFQNHPNILRLFVGTEAVATPTDSVVLLETNLDDCPAEFIGYAMEQLLAAGALDAFTVPIAMKKGRPGVIFSVLANAADVEALEAILFRETGTFGIRKQQLQRSTLMRESAMVQTIYGELPVKRGWRAGHEIFTPEYDACAAAARSQGVPLRVVYAEVLRSAHA